MIAKINLDGKEHLAIVLDDSFSYEDVTHFRKAINSYMKTAEAHFDSNGCDYVLHCDNYYLHVLMEEMEFTEEQMFDMASSYFAHDSEKEGRKSKEKHCKIYL